MSALVTDDQIAAPDDLYQALVDAHEGLADAESRQLNARLILLLANHVGDLAVLQEAAALARASVLRDRPDA
ncbi:DUF2783 domain-containing protein [Alphaproteobacteria bacterium]|jgi:hypothetical protein|nr:DUF2783 domain-containing protein [Alphaproteobacteria bacterium]